jgi:DNA-binding response OmpR family regulator
MMTIYPAILTVLIVDEQPSILSGLSQALTAEGYEVFTAVDGIEALAVLSRHPVDLILSDMVMPRMDGYQLLCYVRSRSDWDSIRFLFLTAFEWDSDALCEQSPRADIYLTRPIQPEDLLAVIRALLQQPCPML